MFNNTCKYIIMQNIMHFEIKRKMGLQRLKKSKNKTKWLNDLPIIKKNRKKIIIILKEYFDEFDERGTIKNILR